MKIFVSTNLRNILRALPSDLLLFLRRLHLEVEERLFASPLRAQYILDIVIQCASSYHSRCYVLFFRVGSIDQRCEVHELGSLSPRLNDQDFYLQILCVEQS